MKKQITSLIILIALINLTSHTIDKKFPPINNKKSYTEFITYKYPAPRRKQQTLKEFMQEVINDKSQTSDLLRDALISNILHKQALTEYILAQ